LSGSKGHGHHAEEAATTRIDVLESFDLVHDGTSVRLK
jgi:hypothetical protein